MMHLFHALDASAKAFVERCEQYQSVLVVVLTVFVVRLSKEHDESLSAESSPGQPDGPAPSPFMGAFLHRLALTTKREFNNYIVRTRQRNCCCLALPTIQLMNPLECLRGHHDAVTLLRGTVALIAPPLIELLRCALSPHHGRMPT